METIADLDVLPPDFLDQGPVAQVPVTTLLSADSPRRSGEDPEHIRALAESEGPLPPVIVHRPTMRVIDGMHRLRAAMLRGEERVEVRFFDGDAADAFVLAVRANVLHGLPLTLADRKAAARRIMKFHPQWSDRMIASVAGLSGKTVAAIRGATAAPEPDTRVGRDGKVRSLTGARGRKLAAEVITANPGASLREIARQANISPETARDVRARLLRGESPVVMPARSRGRPAPAPADHGTRPDWSAGAPRPGGGRPQAEIVSPLSALDSLKADPALRMTESGRALLRLLDTGRVIEEHGKRLAEALPPHCRDRVSEAVRACCDAWQRFETEVEQSQAMLSQANG